MTSDDYVEVREKEIANITEEGFVVCAIARGDVILVQLAGRRAFVITQLK